MKKNTVIIEILTALREGKAGYYETLEKIIMEYSKGFISLTEVDEALAQLVMDFSKIKTYGYNAIDWEVL